MPPSRAPAPACPPQTGGTTGTGGAAGMGGAGGMGGTAGSDDAGADGLPVMSYYHDIGRLKVLKCGDAACSPATNVVSIVDSPLNTSVGRYTSIAVPADGLPIISYHDLSNGSLKIAKCGNVACQ